jgi:hypothetical protein
MFKGGKWRLMTAAVLAGFFWSAAAAAGVFMAGAAAADITPDVKAMHVPSSGYGQRKGKPMQGVHDRVFCKALAVSDEKQQAAIVTCDLIGISATLRDKVLAGLAGSGIADENLLMAASHTHSGPGAMMKNLIADIGFGWYNEELTQETADRIVAAIKTALKKMQPATLRVGETKLPDLIRNRRDPAGSYNYDTRRFGPAYDPQNPANVIDPTLTVIRIDDLSGRPIAVLFHFPAHATVFGADNWLISADWPGEAQRRIEAQVPGAVAMFLTGAEGDQEPTMVPDSRTDEEYVKLIGGQVADNVIRILNQTAPVSAAPVRAIMVHRRIPPGNKIMGVPVPGALIRHYFPSMPLQAIRLGDVVFMCCPVEMIAELGLTMKNGARGEGVKYPLVIGLANEEMLYSATPEEFPRGGYEVDNTIFGETEAGILIGEQLMLVRRLLRP